MSRYAVIRVVVLGAIVLITAAVWGVGRIQATSDDNSTHAIAGGQRMLIAMLDQETGLRGFVNTRDDRFLEPYRDGRTAFERAINETTRYATDADDKPRIAEQIAVARRWQALADAEIR